MALEPSALEPWSHERTPPIGHRSVAAPETVALQLSADGIHAVGPVDPRGILRTSGQVVHIVVTIGVVNSTSGYS